MLHLLVGEDPTPLGVAPFTPRFIAGRQVLAGDIKLAAAGLAPETPIQLLPGILRLRRRGHHRRSFCQRHGV